MQKLATAAIVASLISGPAIAADLPVKVPLKAPPIVAAYDWTGFYLGVHAGYSVAREQVTESSAFTDTTAGITSLTGDRFRLSPAGWLGGVQAGYNWQFARSWVAGVEADWSWTDQHDSACVFACIAGNAFFAPQQKLNWLSTVRGRLGYAQDGWLWYVTAGGAWGRVSETDVFADLGTTTSTFDRTPTGWTAGVGVEAAIAGNWTGRVEYLYVDLGHAGTATFNQAVPGFTERFIATEGSFRENIFRLGLNYRFAGANQMAAASRAVAAPLHDWTGFYLGGNVGYGIAHNFASTQHFSFPGSPIETHTLSPAGAIAGGQVGYNWQLARNWVVGAEVDGQWAGQKDSSCTDGCNFVPQFNAAAEVVSIDQQLRWLATARGRVGYAMGDWLAYVTGGAAAGGIRDNYLLNVNGNGFTTVGQLSHTKGGWTIGTGIETALVSRWTAKLEYLYVDLGTVSDVVANTPGFGFATFNTTWHDHIVRVGVNYSFGQPAPRLIAK